MAEGGGPPAVGPARPFRLEVPEAVLDDLRLRLDRARLPTDPWDQGWADGTDGAALAELLDRWRHGYDWRATEAALGRLDHARAEVGGALVHHVVVRGTGTGWPVVLLHGWPGSFLEMTRLATRLADPGAHGGDPATGVDVVVPTLPGYGLSEPLARPGGFMAMAEVVHQLVVGVLGIDRYVVHGTDVGGTVAGWMAIRHPDRVAAVHTVEPYTPRASLVPPAAPPTPEERAYLADFERWQVGEGAYAHLQLTKPGTLAVALEDSPAALAAWLLEKYRSWSDCGGDVWSRYAPDELLDIVTLYWATGAGASSVRTYRRAGLHDRPVLPGERSAVPAGIAVTPPNPLSPPRHAPRSLVERVYDVRHWVDLPRGGHFVSWEEPALVEQSIRTLVATATP